MSRRTVVLLVAVLLAAVAAFSVWQYLETVERDVRADVAEVAVYRATGFIDTGTEGAAAEAAIEPATALAESVVFEGSTILCTGPSDPEGGGDPAICAANPSDLDALLGNTVAAGPISRGQLITNDMFVAPTELGVRLADDIPAGKVALGISPGAVASAGGHIQAGDHVNVLATVTLDRGAINQLLSDPETRDLLLDPDLLPGFLTSPPQTEPPEEGEEPEEPPGDALSQYLTALPDTADYTQTILQDIPVLAVGGQTLIDPSTDAEPSGEETVILEVTTAQAEQLELARQVAVLSLALLPSEGPYTEFDAAGAITEDVFRFIERVRADLEAIGGG